MAAVSSQIIKSRRNTDSSIFRKQDADTKDTGINAGKVSEKEAWDISGYFAGNRIDQGEIASILESSRLEYGKFTNRFVDKKQ